MNSYDVTARAKIHHALVLHGRDLILEVKDTAPVYDTATATITAGASTLTTVRGRMYRKNRRRRVVQNNEVSEVWLSVQMAVIEAQDLATAPAPGDYLLEDSNRWAIAAVVPQQGAEVVLTYELELAQA